MSNSLDDIIIGISTALSEGAISIIRLSGKGCIELVNKCFKGKNLTKALSHTINYGYIIDENKEIIVTCTTGNSAKKCATILEEKGYQVTVLEGGLMAWKELRDK